MSFFRSKRHDLEPEWTLMTQLESLDERLTRTARSSGQFSNPRLTKKLGAWDVDGDGWSSDEELLVHTFINSQPQQGTYSPRYVHDKQRRGRGDVRGGRTLHSAVPGERRLSWIDDLTRKNIKM